ncbi:MAG: glutamyl-tRNA reductase [Chloroflexi bacterium]|nr:glutamyl-tRNA reductase [Chloroflexota bacterium]
MMRVLAVGLNHRTAPLEVRERLALTAEKLPEALRVLAECAGQGVILSTCNRTELYTLEGDHAHGHDGLLRFLDRYYGVAYEELFPYLYEHQHGEAARHLLRVACGLDSMILGESEVLGQVRSAFGAAVAARTVRNPLSHLFHHALRVGKRARRETDIGRNALSASRACIELARNALGALQERRALVVGAGDAGRLAARALADNGVTALLVTNRTRERAEELAQELGGKAIPFQELPQTLTQVDIVVCSTGAPGYILPQEILRQVVEERQRRPLFLLDIAVPRDVDPAVKGLPGVFLYDVDDLDVVAKANYRQREEEARKVEAIVEEEVRAFLAWWDGLTVIPTVAALRERMEALRQREVAHALQRLAHLADEDKAVVESLSLALVKKLLHQPITTLKGARNPQHLQAVRELFGLEGNGREA